MNQTTFNDLKPGDIFYIGGGKSAHLVFNRSQDGASIEVLNQGDSKNTTWWMSEAFLKKSTPNFKKNLSPTELEEFIAQNDGKRDKDAKEKDIWIFKPETASIIESL